MNKLLDQLKKEAEYAQKSLSENLLYEVYGKALMARQLSALTFEEFMKLNEMTVYFMNTHARELDKSNR